MATHILVNWSANTVKEVFGGNYVQGLVDGIDVGVSGHLVAVYRVDVSPIERLYPAPEPPPEEEA
jgi:hypothetical protein